MPNFARALAAQFTFCTTACMTHRPVQSLPLVLFTMQRATIVPLAAVRRANAARLAPLAGAHVRFYTDAGFRMPRRRERVPPNIGACRCGAAGAMGLQAWPQRTPTADHVHVQPLVFV
jgi:hypothetical protein